MDEEEVIGFMPMKPSSGGRCIDNYYIKDDCEETLDGLLRCAVADYGYDGLLSALVHKRHVPYFYKNGFRTFIEWKKYDKMDYIFKGRQS